MNFNQNFTILFWISRAKANKKGEMPIYIRITVDNRRVECSTSRWILEENWNAELSRPHTNFPEGAALNEYLLFTKAEITKHYNILLATKENITAEDVKRSYKGIREKVVMFSEVFSQFNQVVEDRRDSGQISKGRYYKFEKLIGRAEEFIKHKSKVSDIPLKDVRPGFVAEFYNYLRTNKKLQQNSAMREVKDLKQVMEYAVMLEYIPSNPFRHFKCTLKKIRRTKLTSLEVELLHAKEIKNPRLAEMRDCYLFAIYTGYSYKQLHELTPDHIQTGIDGRKWIVIVRSKSDTTENVPLLPIAWEIIQKYKDHPMCRTKNRLLPMKSNQKYNEYLQEIATICGIEKHLTSHTARHTFATTITLENGVPIETVSKMLGHSDIRTTQIYAEITDTRISEDTIDLHEKIEKRRERDQKRMEDSTKVA